MFRMEDLVHGDAERRQDPPRLHGPGDDLLTGPEQAIRVEVDRPRGKFDVTGIGEAGADDRPHREQPLQYECPIVTQGLVDGVQPAASGDCAVQFPREPSGLLAPDSGHLATARGYPCRFGIRDLGPTRRRP
jgi:hypothetical protein